MSQELENNNENTEEANEQPLPASLKFEDLLKFPEVVEALNQAKFFEATDVQAQTLQDTLAGNDVIVQARTGSGKTLAYVIPLLCQLIEKADSIADDTFALIVAPTRELVNQVTHVIGVIDAKLNPVSIIGGVSIDGQIKSLKKDPRIVVGTPGRILDLIRQRKLSLRKCRYFVLDEADEMLSMGFLEDVRAILSRLPDQRQGLFVSATISPRVQMLANSFLTKPTLVTVDVVGEDLPPIEHFHCTVGGDLMAKPLALCDLIETIRPKNAIIFCNTKSDTHLVEVLLRRRGFDARRINSDLTQKQRDRIMDKIRSQDLQFLVATDIAARGLDLDQIELVVNFSIHDQPDTYIHRTGRTGRAGRSGTAISLIGPRDFGAFHFLQKVVKAEFKEMPLPTDEDVANARLAHLYEVIRQAEIEPDERNLLVARKMIAELGAEGEISDELVDFSSKLCHFVLDHFVQHEASALEEELEAESASSKEKSKSRDRKEPRSRGKEDRKDTRSRDRDRDRDRDEKKPRSKQDDDNKKSKPKREERKEASSEEPEPKERKPLSPEENLYRRLRKLSKDEQVRICLGQGTSGGISEVEVRELVSNFAELEEDSLKRVLMRDEMCFVDVAAPEAEKVLKNLNGIEYNGDTLNVEFATVILQKRHQNRNKRDDRRGNSKNRGGRGDNRRRDGGGGRGQRSGGNRR
jgi:ATP-dependent RNA helicase DeaD